MLITRIITGVILIALVVWGVYDLPVNAFSWITLLIFLWLGWEYSRLMSAKKSLRIGFLVVLFLLCFIASVLWFSHLYLMVLSTLFWLWAIASVFYFQKQKTAGFHRPAIIALFGWVMLLAAWVGINDIWNRINGHNYIMLMLLLVWAVDIGAYFSGRIFGKRKLADQVSPKKTWEGVWGATILGLIVYYLFASLFGLSFLAGWSSLPWVIVMMFFAVMGDLCESMLKRQTGIKDSSAVLPGHGGLFDRLDAFLAVVPLFFLLLGAAPN